jgi:hypothetical protein
MAFIGTPLDTRNTFQSLVGKRFNGDGSTTAFTLDVAPSSVLDIEVFVGNVRQDPNSAYTLSGTTLTFTGAPPSGTNNIYVVHQAKSVGTIDPPATETIAKTFSGGVTLSGTTTHSGALNVTGGLDSRGGAVFNEGSADEDFRVESNGNSSMLLVDAGNDRVGIGLSSPLCELHVDAAAGAATEARVSAGTVYTKVISDDASGFSAIDYSHDLRFKDAGTEKMRIDSSNNLLHAKTSANSNTVGIELRPAGELTITRTNNQLLDINRTDDDGTLVTFRQANSTEGTIAVSGGTVSYNTFMGAHWSRLADNSKPTILRGSVMETIATMCDWYQVDYTNKDGKSITEYIGALPDEKSVGDNHTVTVADVEYTGKISKEKNYHLPMCKISDTEDSKAVYGVFHCWDNDDNKVNDMNIASLGTYMIRIHKDETVAIGDYLQSKGDGTAKKQADDILRASTIAKVTSTEKVITHGDGSYCVPCTLHCG